MSEIKKERSREINEDIKRFLAAGGTIKICYHGETGEKDMDFAGRQLRAEAQRKPVELSGQRFGKLVALHRSQDRMKKGYWTCRCDCGETVQAEKHSLLRGKRFQCDKCAKRSSVEAKRKKKGETNGKV